MSTSCAPRMVRAAASNTSRPLTAVVLSSRDKILELSSSAGYLLQNRDATALPAFFLASIDPHSWRPLVVVVRRGTAIRAILYAKERRLAGLLTGLIYADTTIDSLVSAPGDEDTELFQAAISHLLRKPRIMGLRLLVPANHRFETLLDAAPARMDMDVHRSRVQNHCILDLSGTYDQFLDRLGTRTRRNYRYYRRLSESAGNRYVANMSFDDFQRAAFVLHDKGVTGNSLDGIHRALRMIAATGHPMLAGLRGPDGAWLAIVGGWYERGRAVIFCQMNNDKDFPRSSLCAVLRAHLFDSLISRSVARVMFWAGVGGPISAYCDYLPTTAIYLDRPTFVWRTFRNAFSKSVKYLPDSIGNLAQWVSPGAASAKS